MNVIVMFWISVMGFFGIVIVGMLIIEHRYKKRQKRTEEKVEIMRKIVNRNKLRDDTQESIDDIVKFLKENNISLYQNEIYL